ncbi:MAG TPA: hypothetical protein VF101_19665 [Gaiellaceae bacterium]
MKRAVILVAAAALLSPAAARADGDPASDVLLSQNVFVTYTVKVPKAQSDELNALVAAAKNVGFGVKVALIATPADLGAVPSLFGKPKRYAEFLGREIVFVYPGRLLVVMPGGYGVSRRGALVPREQTALDALPRPGSDGSSLVRAADQAIRRLAELDGVQIPAEAPKPSGHSTHDRLEILGIALSVLVIVALFAIPRRRRRG